MSAPTPQEAKDRAAFIKWLRQQDERDDSVGDLARGKFPKLDQDGSQDGGTQYTRVQFPAWAQTIDQLRYQIVNDGAPAEAVEALDAALEEWRGATSEDVIPCEYGHTSKRNEYGECVTCNRQRARDWRAANPEAAAEQRRRTQLQKQNTDNVLNERPATGAELAELQHRTLLAEIASGEKPASALLPLQVREYVQHVAEQCAFKLHLNQLRGRDVPRLAVINDVVTRLCAPDGPFSSVPPTGGREQFDLVYRELDSARKRYAKEMGRVSISEGPIDDTALADLDRHTEEGQALVNEPTVAWARDQSEADELARIEARPVIEAAENADIEKDVSAWAATLKPKALAALNLLRSEPEITDTEVHRRVKKQYGSFNHERVPELRAELNKIRDRWRTIPSEWSPPVTDMGREKEITRLPDAPTTDLEAVDGGTRSSLRYEKDSLGEAASRYDATSTGGVFNVIEADTADSSNSRGGVAQSEIAGAWGAGKRHYDVDQLATGRGGYGGDPTRLADQQKFSSNFTEAELRRLREQADVADMNVRQLMIEMAEYAAKATEQAAPDPSPEQQLQGMDPALVPMFLLAMRAQMSIQTCRDVLQAADRAEVSRGSLGGLLTDLITFNGKRQAEDEKAQEQSRQAQNSVRRKRRSKRVPVRVKPRKRVIASG
jgi:hypothetical protein